MQSRLRVIRVKRKRNADAPDDIVVEGLEASAAKRAHTTLSAQLDTMSLGGDTAEAEADAPGSDDVGPRRGIQCFHRLTTLSAAQVLSLDEEQLNQLIHARCQQQVPRLEGAPEQPQQPQPLAPQEPQPGAPTQPAGASRQLGPSAAAVPSAAQSPPAPSGLAPSLPAPRYEQIRPGRRGLTLFQATEAGPDPLAGFATVYDVVRRDSSGNEGDRCTQRQHGGQPELQGGAATQPAAWRQYAEGTLMCNQQPVLREAATAAAAAGSAASLPTAAMPSAGPQQVAPSWASGEVRTGIEVGSGGSEESGDGEYVYDLYTAAGPAEAEGASGETARWMELHSSGRAPVIQILGDESWLVVEASDAEDSNAGTEDSNAEGYHAHDYPEEASDYTSGDDDDYDPEGPGFGSRRRSNKDLWEGSDGGGSDSSEDAGPFGTMGSRRSYW